MITKLLLSRFTIVKSNLADIVSNFTKITNKERLGLILKKARMSVTDPEEYFIS